MEEGRGTHQPYVGAEADHAHSYRSSQCNDNDLQMGTPVGSKKRGVVHDGSSRAESEFDDQAFSWRNAPELRSTIRRELGNPMACSDTNCVMVRDTVSIVSPR